MPGRSPAFLPLVCLIGCVLCADFAQISAFIWWGIALVAVLVALVLFRRFQSLQQFVPSLLLSITIGAGGAAYYQAARLDGARFGIPEQLIDTGDVTLFGAIRDWPRVSSDRTELIVDLDSIVADRGYPLHAAVQVVIADTTTFVQHNDRVQATGRLMRTAPSLGRFSYQRYLARQGIGAQLYLSSIVEIMRLPQDDNFFFSLAHSFRTWLVQTLKKVLPQAEASLAAGFLVGETRDLPMSTMLLFRETGTLHLLAVSGANVWLVVGFLMLILRPVPIGRWARTIIILLSLLVFMLMCYAEPSVMRASVLVMLVLIGRLAGRRLDLLHLLTVAALVMLLVAPWQMFSVGFQLSFLTASALVAALIPFQEWLEAKRMHRMLQAVLLAVAGSVVASLISAPLVWWNFERFSVMSIPANIVVAPFVTIATVGALSAAVVYQFVPLVGVWVGTLVHLPLYSLLTAVSWFGQVADDLRIPIRDDIAAGIVVFGFYGVALSCVIVPRPKRIFVASLFFLLTVSALFSRQIIESNQPSHQVMVEAIPGGFLVALTRDQWKSADLVVTGLRSRRYPVDSVIIAPMIERYGVQKINSIAAMNVEFNAVDDVLRMSQATNSNQLLLDPKDRHPFHDWVMLEPGFEKINLKVHAPPDSQIVNEGVSMSESGYLWADSLISFWVPADTLSKQVISQSERFSIILGPTTLAGSNQFRSVDLFLCAESEQAEKPSPIDLNEPDSAINLSRIGGVHIFVADRLRIQTASGKTIFRKRTNAR